MTCLLIPVLACAFTLLFFVFQTDVSKMWNFTVMKNRLGSFYKLQYNVTSPSNQTRIEQMKEKESLKYENIRKTTTTTGMRMPQTNVFKVYSPVSTLLLAMSPSKSTRLQPILPTTVKTTTGHPATTKTMAATLSSLKTLPDMNTSQHSLCPNFLGGFGNNLFQFASNFGIAMSKNMSVIVNQNSELNRIFKLDVDIRQDTDICHKFLTRTERMHCGYDENLVKFNNSVNVKLGQYLQSWKYFYDYRNELRKQLTFRDSIQSEANETINRILKKFKFNTRGDVTLVGVHVRRGDMVNHAYGYNVATPEYLAKAVEYFQSKFKNVLFIITTQDLLWTQKHMPNNTQAEYISHPKREIVVATLALCDHTITTVGSFGWWIGWLTGGEVTYFKWPAKEGSGLRRQFTKDFSDYFYPGWIGL